jgi:hypothetical protein
MKMFPVKAKFSKSLNFHVVLLKRFITHSFFGATIWAIKGAKLPAPNYLKYRVLEREFLRSGICIETGTYLGETTLRLSKMYPLVVSIEPDERLYAFAKMRFKRKYNVELVLGTSENRLSEVLSRVEDGSDVNFWLDGHFSGGFTFLGENEMPIIQELKVISDNLARLDSVVVAIDDFRDLGCSTSEVLSRDFLVKFAQENSLTWNVELDMFFMRKGSVS